MKLNTLALVAILLIVTDVHGQQTSQPVSFGVELDVLPYATGGYFGAAWVARGPYRLRGLHARVHMPEFVVEDGFTNNNIDAFALLVDRFPESNGLWFGGGMVYWRGDIQSDARIETTDYDSYLLNGGMGYVYYLTRHLYASPWAGLSIRMGGDADVVVDGQKFEPPRLNPEASLKFGWAF